MNIGTMLKKSFSSGSSAIGRITGSKVGKPLTSFAGNVLSGGLSGLAKNTASTLRANTPAPKTPAQTAAASQIKSPSAVQGQDALKGVSFGTQPAYGSPVKAPTAPVSGGGSWGSVPAIATKSPTLATKPVSAPAQVSDGYSSSDPTIMQKIAAMQKQAIARPTDQSFNIGATITNENRPPKVINETQNADGTKTQYFDDGSKSVIRLNKQESGTYTPEELSSKDYTGNLAELLRNQPQNSVTAARERLLGLYGPSAEESQYQDELTTAQENARLGNVALEGQGRAIPLALIRGQQGKLHEQAEIGQQTIIQRLAAAQAKRQAEQQIASQELGYATSDQASQVQQSQFEKNLAQQQSQFGQNLALQQSGQANTLQGQMLAAGYVPAPKGFQASADSGSINVGGQTYVPAPKGAGDGFTLSEGQQRYDANGNLIAGTPKQIDPYTQQKNQLEIMRLQQQLEGGNPTEQAMAYAQLQKLQQEMSGDSEAKVNATNASRELLQNKLGLIKGLLSEDLKSLAPGGIGAVGTAPQGRVKVWGINLGKVQNFIAGVEQLTSQETMKALADLKARGATLGALSDKELQLLYSSASKIGSWRRQDKNGNIHYAATNDDFRNELNNLLTLTQKGLQEVPGGQQQLDPSSLTAEDFLYMQEAYPDFDPSVFTKAPSKAVNGSLGSLSEKFESGGNPGAVGYDSTGGLSYGTYQLAHNNANRFVQSSPFRKFFEGIAFNSQQFVNKWKEVAKAIPQEFAKAQKDYIAATHFLPQMQKIAQAGLSAMVRNPVLRDVIWSTAVQHGAATSLIVQALKALPAHASDADKIKAIYNARWNGGRGFASSTPAVRKAVFNRFFGPQGEMQMALRRLTG